MRTQMTAPRRATGVAIAASLLAAGCGFSFERPSEVLDRRVLAIRIEPPELVADGGPLPQTVQLSALVVDPGPGGAAIPYEWRTCLPGGRSATAVLDAASTSTDSATETSTDSSTSTETATDEADEAEPFGGRCLEQPETLLAGGEASWEQISQLSVPMPVPTALAFAAQQAAAQGFAVPIYLNAQLRLATDRAAGTEPLYAYKRLVLSPSLPAGRKANRNPQLAGVLFDGRPWFPGEVLKVSRAACPEDRRTVIPDPMDPALTYTTCTHRVTPAFDPAQAEPYEVVAFDGELLSLQERLRFSWFADRGSFARQTTEQPGAVALERRDPLSTDWREPRTGEGLVRLWVVVRDGRGGTGWESRTLEVVP